MRHGDGQKEVGEREGKWEWQQFSECVQSAIHHSYDQVWPSARFVSSPPFFTRKGYFEDTVKYSNKKIKIELCCMPCSVVAFKDLKSVINY